MQTWECRSERCEFMSDVQHTAAYLGREGWQMAAMAFLDGAWSVQFQRSLPDPQPDPEPTTWTTALPTKPGFYWYERLPGETMPASVFEGMGELRGSLPGVQETWPLSAAIWTGRWQGPILPKP